MSSKNLQSLSTKLKACHNKQSWEYFFRVHKDDILKNQSPKIIHDIARRLEKDPLSLNYDPIIWETLLQACIDNWDLELGRELTKHVKKLAYPQIILLCARIQLESGQPQEARHFANRALRLTGLQPEQKLQLEMTICQSYVDEGKRKMAIRLLNRMEKTITGAQLQQNERAQFFANIARINFFLGRYPQAGDLFLAAAQTYVELENWFEAARSFYNAGSSYFNAGGKHESKAFGYIEDSRRLAERYEFRGPLSYIEAFYGHHDYWHGNFAGARDHYLRAYKYIPRSDQRYRTLHVLSMLSLIYLRMGQFNLAQKFGQKTLALSEKDQSERFRSRYHNLRAEILWESGDIEKSQDFLRVHTSALYQNGVNTLEELSTLSRFYTQCALLKEDAPTRLNINDQLSKNPGEWVEHLYAKAQLLLSQGLYSEALACFMESKSKAEQYNDIYHYSLNVLGLIQLSLMTKDSLDKAEALLEELEISLAKLVETPVKLHIYFIRAALAYRRGQFDKVRYHLDRAASFPRQRFHDKYILSVWKSTLNGQASRIHYDWQEALIGQLTKIYFAPSLKALNKRKYLVSNLYEVDLTKYTALADIIYYLLERSKFAASLEEIQLNVWQQSLSQQGWKQKIRNTLMRLRDKFPYTMAPIVIHNNHISLFHAAIEIEPVVRQHVNPQDEILRLLQEGPMSTQHLANRLKISSATTKRLLKKLTDTHRVQPLKLGRRVLYHAQSEQTAPQQQQ